VPAGRGQLRACPSPTTFTGLADGPHDLEVRAVDPSGRFDTTPAMWHWHEEDCRPTPESRSPPRARRSPASQDRHHLRRHEAGFDVRVQSRWRDVRVTCASPFTVTALADGAHIAGDPRDRSAWLHRRDAGLAHMGGGHDKHRTRRSFTGPEDGVVTNSGSALFRLTSEARRALRVPLGAGRLCALLGPGRPCSVQRDRAGPRSVSKRVRSIPSATPILRLQHARGP